jgi:RNA-binding protein YhbY
VAVELAKAEGREKYEAAVEALRQRTQLAFTELSQLRHRTAVAKIPAVIEHLQAALDGDEDHKVVLFAHHKDVVKTIMEALAAKEVSAVQVTGDTGLMERQANVDKFQRDPKCRVFVGNIQAAGVGITLTAAAHVIFAELDWVPGNVTQAEDRCHRIGQRDSVLVEHLVLDGSLDARMARTLIAKQYVIDAALDNERPALAAEVETPSKDRAATQDLTVDKLAKIAEKMTPELCALVLEGLQILAGLDGDFARDQNGVGFGRMDVQIGHSLAESGSLSPRQGAIAAKLCNKYRRQLPENIADAAKAALQ